MIVIYIIMFISWAAWFSMNFTDPLRMAIPGWMRYAGLILFFTGISLFIFSHISIRGFEDKGKLVTKGIYSKIRNPMYLGFILWIIGFPLLMQSLATFATGIFWIAHIICWKILEEKELERKYEEYGVYKKKTWF